MTTANEYLYEINRLNTDVSNFLIKIKSIDKNSMRYAIEKAGIYSKFKKKFGDWTGIYPNLEFSIITNLKNRIRSEKFNGKDKAELIHEINTEILPKCKEFAAMVQNRT